LLRVWVVSVISLKNKKNCEIFLWFSEESIDTWLGKLGQHKSGWPNLTSPETKFCLRESVHLSYKSAKNNFLS
jgi:hypothetical protein